MMKSSSHILNASIQVIPLTQSNQAMEIVDRSIGIIEKSGLPYTVCPFETSIDGTWEEIMELLNQLKNQLQTESIDDALIQVKFHLSNRGPIVGESKTAKFKQS